MISDKLLILITDKNTVVTEQSLCHHRMEQKIKNVLLLPTAEEQSDGAILCVRACAHTLAHTDSHRGHPGDQSVGPQQSLKLLRGFRC